jgi:Phage major capsid protein E
MALIDAFAGKAFQMSSLGDAIRVMPNMYGRVGELGLFREKKVATTSVQIEYKNGVLNLLTSSERGGNGGTVGKAPKRNVKPFNLYHWEHDDFIYADDIQNVRAFGQEFQLQALSELVTDKLFTLNGKFDITEEYLLNGAIKGVLVDGDGTTLLDTFADFGITQQVQSFQFSNVNADMGQSLVNVVGYMEDNLLGDTMTGVTCLASPEWFASYTTHPSVVEAFKFYGSTQEPLREDVRRRFVHKGVVIEEYRGSASYLNPDNTSTVRKFIPAGDARFVPMGTMDTFRLYVGPPDFVNDANKVPVNKRYVKMLADPSGKDKFVGMHAQTNFLPICVRPPLLVRGSST